MELSLTEKIKKLHELKEALAAKEAAKKELDAEVKSLSSEVDSLAAELLKGMDAIGAEEVESEGLVAYTSSTKTTGYISEQDVIDYLSNNGYDAFIKVAKSIKKRELNAELKGNESLKEALGPLLTTTVTRYATVSTKENREKQLVHIAESKGGK